MVFQPEPKQVTLLFPVAQSLAKPMRAQAITPLLQLLLLELLEHRVVDGAFYPRGIEKANCQKLV